jgi:hypothetical protein
VWGTVEDVHDEQLHQRFTDDLFAGTGFDLRGQPFATHLVGAAAVEVADGHMDVTTWHECAPERFVRKHCAVACSPGMSRSGGAGPGFGCVN